MSGSTSRSSVVSKCQSSVRTVTAGSDNPAGSKRLRRSTPRSAHAAPRRPLSRAPESPERVALFTTSLCDAPSHTATIKGSSTASRIAASGEYASHICAHAVLSILIVRAASFAVCIAPSLTNFIIASTAFTSAVALSPPSSSNVTWLSSICAVSPASEIQSSIDACTGFARSKRKSLDAMRNCTIRGKRSAQPILASVTMPDTNAVAVARSNRIGPEADAQNDDIVLSDDASALALGNSARGTPSMALSHCDACQRSHISCRCSASPCDFSDALAPDASPYNQSK